MADNYDILDANGAVVTVGADEVSAVKYSRVKPVVGADGAQRDVVGAATPYKLTSALSNNAQSIKASAGYVHSINAANVNAAVRYLKLYNKASAPAPATDNALLIAVIPLPANGLPVAIAYGDHPLYFSTGIAMAIVTDASDTGNTSTAASEQFVTVGYN
jgi:hypothetical protein